MGYTSVDMIAPDSDFEVICPGCNRLTIQVTNQAVYITFGQGLGMPLYGMSEPYLPTTGQLIRQFDAFKIRAYTPASQLPAGIAQAHVQATPIPAGA